MKIYYRVKPEYDQRRFDNIVLVAGTCYTKRERSLMPNVPDEVFECVGNLELDFRGEKSNG